VKVERVGELPVTMARHHVLQADQGRLLAARARYSVLHAERGKQASRISANSRGYTEASSASPFWPGK